MRKLIVKESEKNSLVVQSNKLIESRYSLTLGEQRLILAMVSMIHPDDKDFFDYEIKIKELAEILNINLKNAYREADKITERLMGRVLHIPQPNGDLLKAHWVSSALHKKGSVKLAFSPKLKPYLLKLQKEFTKFRLTIITQFQSVYSVRIYQLLKQYKQIGSREFEVNELKEILGLKESQYPAFKDFNRRVLNQAKKEFEKKNKGGYYQCDFTFKIETIREGRKITRVKFIIIAQAYQEQLPFLNKKGIQEVELKDSTKERLKFYGISDKQAEIFVHELEDENIKDVLDYYAERLKAGKVINEGGAYLAKLLQEGVVIKTPHSKQKETEVAEKLKLAEEKKEAENLAEKKAKKLREEKEKKIKEILTQKTKKERLALTEEYKKTLPAAMHNSFEKYGEEAIQFRFGFYTFLSEKFNLK